MRKYFAASTHKKLKKIKVCENCKKKKSPLQKHHKRPVSKGGTNNINNIMMVCEDCHKQLDLEAMEKYKDYHYIKEKWVEKKRHEKSL